MKKASFKHHHIIDDYRIEFEIMGARGKRVLLIKYGYDSTFEVRLRRGYYQFRYQGCSWCPGLPGLSAMQEAIVVALKANP